MSDIEFALRSEFIPLDALLKATGLAPSGGMAKAWVAQGLVRVDGEVETRKTCKIRAGQRVSLQGHPGEVRVSAAGGEGMVLA
jgi:ribosome-associated protein